MAGEIEAAFAFVLKPKAFELRVSLTLGDTAFSIELARARLDPGRAQGLQPPARPFFGIFQVQLTQAAVDLLGDRLGCQHLVPQGFDEKLVFRSFLIGQGNEKGNPNFAAPLGPINGKRYLIMDRDTKFCESFRSILQHADVDPVKLPARSPNLNAHMERFMRSVA